MRLRILKPKKMEFLDNEKILWRYQPNKWKYSVQLLKKIIPPLLTILLIGMIMPLSGRSTWELYFILAGVIAGLAILSPIVYALLGKRVTYTLTNMRIYINDELDTLCWEIFYYDIKDIQLVGAGKKIGSIKVIPRKLDELDYSLYMIENPDEVYRLIMSLSGLDLEYEYNPYV